MTTINDALIPFNIKAFFQSNANCGCTDSQLSTPRGLAESNVIMCNKSGIFSIVSLLKSRSPFAVFRGIVSIIVDALKGESFWSVTHVAYKVCKIIKPPTTNCNPPSTVPMKQGVVRIGNSLLHSRPRDMRVWKLRFLSAGNCSYSFIPVAATGLSFTANKMRCSHILSFAAVAKAMPSSRAFCKKRNNGKSIEFLTRKVFECRHINLRKISRKIKRGNLLRLQMFGLHTLATGEV